MSKFHFVTLMQNLSSFTHFLKNSVDNLRSGISKNALMFTTEFLGHENQLSRGVELDETMINFIDVVAPSILQKTVYDKLFIAKEAKSSINNANKHCFYKEFLTILL